VRAAIALLLLSLPTILAANEAAQVTIGIVMVDPTGPTTLHKYDEIYIGIHYKSNVPVKIFVSPSLNKVYSMGSLLGGGQVLPAGEGEALDWIAGMKPYSADTINIVVQSAQTGEVLRRLEVPAIFNWDGQDLPKREPAPWVKELVQKLASKK